MGVMGVMGHLGALKRMGECVGVAPWVLISAGHIGEWQVNGFFVEGLLRSSSPSKDFQFSRGHNY